MRVKNYAFTMAEAILVMTILGIIATIMITTLKPAEYKEKSLKIAAKRVLTEIDNATTQILTNDTDMGSVTSLIDSSSNSFSWADDSNKVMELYKKYLVTSSRDTVPTTSFCVTGDNSYNATALYLKNGACFGIKSGEIASAATVFPDEDTATNMKAPLGLILFDTNGEDEPNILGKDRYSIPIAADGISYATTSTTTSITTPGTPSAPTTTPDATTPDSTTTSAGYTPNPVTGKFDASCYDYNACDIWGCVECDTTRFAAGVNTGYCTKCADNLDCNTLINGNCVAD